MPVRIAAIERACAVQRELPALLYRAGAARSLRYGIQDGYQKRECFKAGNNLEDHKMGIVVVHGIVIPVVAGDDLFPQYRRHEHRYDGKNQCDSACDDATTYVAGAKAIDEDGNGADY